MVKTKKFEFEEPVPGNDDEHEAILAAIDEGARDVKAGRTVSTTDVHKLRYAIVESAKV